LTNPAASIAIPYPIWDYRPRRELQDGGYTGAAAQAPRRDEAVDPDDRAVLVDESEVDPEPHPECVDGRAARDQQRVAVRQLGQEREPEQARTEAARLKDGQPVADLVRRKAPESPGKHIRVRSRAEKLAPRGLDSGRSADVAQLARAPLS
jgi:hypothetical protein